jgi:ankyrin repeat protein
MLKKGFILLLLTLALTACTQERPATFSSNSEEAKTQENSDQAEATNDIQPLMDAIMNGELEKVKELVTEENINRKDDLSNTPLMIAVQYMDIEIIKVLLDKGADPAIEDDLGVSSLTMATDSENKEIVELLKSYTTK